MEMHVLISCYQLKDNCMHACNANFTHALSCTFYANFTKEAQHFNLSFSSDNVVHSNVKIVLIV